MYPRGMAHDLLRFQLRPQHQVLYHCRVFVLWCQHLRYWKGWLRCDFVPMHPSEAEAEGWVGLWLATERCTGIVSIAHFLQVFQAAAWFDGRCQSSGKCFIWWFLWDFTRQWPMMIENESDDRGSQTQASQCQSHRPHSFSGCQVGRVTIARSWCEYINACVVNVLLWFYKYSWHWFTQSSKVRYFGESPSTGESEKKRNIKLNILWVCPPPFERSHLK